MLIIRQSLLERKIETQYSSNTVEHIYSGELLVIAFRIHDVKSAKLIEMLFALRCVDHSLSGVARRTALGRPCAA